MKRLQLVVFLLSILIGVHYAFSQDIAIISSIPTDKEIDRIALAPNTGIAYGINKEEKALYIIDLKNNQVKKNIKLSSQPYELAVDPTNNLAYITAKGHGKNSALYIIDSEGTILKTIDLPRDPEGIAVNPENKTAVISIEKGKKLLIYSTENLNLLKEIQLPHKPNLIALDTDTQRAVITTKTHTWGWRHNKIQIIDLNTGQILNQTNLKKDIRGLAIDSKKDITIAVSSEQINLIDINNGNIITTLQPENNQHNIKLKKGTPDTGEETENDKDNETETDQYIATDINQSTHTAAITGEEGFLLIDLNQNTIKEYPLEEIEDLKTIAADKDQNTIITAYTTHKTNNKHKPTWWNKHQNGILQIQLPNPIPEITLITPDKIQRATESQTIIITGDKYITSSTAYLNNQALQTTFIDNDNLQANITKELLQTAGTYPITVTNPTPDGGTSNQVFLQITNPVPTIISLEPQELTAGITSQTLTIIGTGFFPETEIHINKKDETTITKKQGTLITNTKLELAFTQENLKTAGQYEIRAYNPTPGGGYSNTAILTIKPSLEIAITSPQNNETINKTKTIVKGTYQSGTKDIGITVNGIIAAILGNEWTANIPLAAGTNTITATIKDNSGSSTNATISINTTGITQQIELTANITSGISPLQVFFNASVSIPNLNSVTYQIDYEGDGTIDYTATTFDNINHTYTNEGIFYPTITITDDQGNTYSDSIAITVLNKTDVDTLLKSKWEGMKEGLASRNIEKSLKYFVEASKDRYRKIFEALEDQLPVIMTTFVEFNIIDVYENVAEYEIVANENGVLYSYPGMLIKDENGIWKFKDF